MKVKKENYQDGTRKLEKLFNMKVMHDTITTDLVKEQEDLEISRRVKTIETTVLVWSARILRRVLETWIDLLSIKIQ